MDVAGDFFRARPAGALLLSRLAVARPWDRGRYIWSHGDASTRRRIEQQDLVNGRYPVLAKGCANSSCVSGISARVFLGWLGRPGKLPIKGQVSMTTVSWLGTRLSSEDREVRVEFVFQLWCHFHGTVALISPFTLPAGLVVIYFSLWF
jgi:hypothetical protein